MGLTWARAAFGQTADPGRVGVGDTPTANKPFKLGAYVEAAYQFNFNQPGNGITHLRGFDNRHNTFTLSNAVVDASWDYANVLGRVALQVGHTPSTYYLAEPSLAGAAGSNATSAELWKYLQQAYVGYRIERLRLTLAGGLFLSPIGPESMAIRDNWNWSRSNLFFGLPFYHTGARAALELGGRWTATVALYNGWNSVVDNNPEKSLSAQLTYSAPKWVVQGLYFGGVERVSGAPEGRAWRHLFDAHATWHAHDRLSLLVHGNLGFERNTFGVSSWAAGAVAARVRLLTPLFFAVRGDLFYEHAASNALGRAGGLFWPVPWVSSATATLDVRPHERVSLRLEYRHDHAGGEAYFGGDVGLDANGAYVANRSSQDTVTVGATTWF